MRSSLRLKTALLAAASLTAASVAVAHAADAAPVEPVAIEHAVQSADHDQDRASPTVIAQKVGLAAALTAGLAGLARLIGFRRLKKVAAATAVAAGKAASAGVAATATAAKAVAKAVASPFRYVLLLASLAAAALAGVGLYDVEWAGGLVFGALLATTIMVGARKALVLLTVRR